MTEPLHQPPTELVADAWLRLAVPDIGVGPELPTVADHPALRTDGFVRTATIGGSPNRDVPMRSPVVAAECWLAPAQGSQTKQWRLVGQLAERILAATYNGALMGVAVDLSDVGSYGQAWVHTVIALVEPRRVDLEDDWARMDIDLRFRWSVA